MPILRLLFRLLVPVFLAAGLNLDAQQPAHLGQTVPGRFLIVYRDPQLPSTAIPAHTRIVHRFDRLGILAVETTEPTSDTLARLAADPNVAAVFQDRIVTAHQLTTRALPNITSFPALAIGAESTLAAPVDPDIFYTRNPQDWAVQQAGGYGLATPGAPAARGPWDTTTGSGVRIAILDSGLDATHPDIAPNLALNLSEVDQTTLPSACDDGTPQDQTGHGTFSASLAAAAAGPSTGLMIGVAPAATLLNIKVLERLPAANPTATQAQNCAAGQASGLLSWIIQGIDDAVTHHADIISLSLGTLVDTTTGDGAGLKAAFDSVTHAAFTAGAVLVAAAGNDALDLTSGNYIEIPAQSRDVLAIVATTNPACHEDLTTTDPCSSGPQTLTYYSNRIPNALAAPGGSYPAGDDFGISGWVRGACTTTGPGCFDLGQTQYVQAIGTSAAAPLAAGVAALYRAAHPTWTPAQIVAALRSAAITTPTLPYPQITAAVLAPQ